MQIVRDLAGYTFGRSDLVRRAMAKKKLAVMMHEKDIFTYGEVKCPDCGGTGKLNGDKCPRCHGDGVVPRNTDCPFCTHTCKCEGKDPNCEKCHGTGLEITSDTCPRCNGTHRLEADGEETVPGCIKNNISVKTATEIFDKMIDFASYAFNKSHAAAYAIIGYQTAYLLRYYPRQYMTAYLNSVITNQEKVRQYIAITKKMGINVIRPNINNCEALFTEDENGIYFGLTSLKYVGSGITEAIAERKRNGIFKDLQDLLERVPLNKREVESLIKSGSLDCFGVKRSQMIAGLDTIMNGTKNDRKIKTTGQLSLFDMGISEELEKYRKIAYPDVNEYTEMEKLSMEKEVSGFYLSGHPLDLPQYAQFTRRSNFTTLDEFTEMDDRRNVKIVGIIQIDESQKEGIRLSKKGTKYATFQIEDKYSTIKVMAFKDACENNEHLIVNGNIVEISGNLKVEVKEYEDENGEINQNIEVRLFAKEIKSISNLSQTKKIYLQLETKNSQHMSQVKHMAESFPGTDELYLFDKSDRQLYKYGKTVGYSDKFKFEIEKVLGKDAVAIR